VNKILLAMGTAITALIGAYVYLIFSVHALQSELNKLDSRMTGADGAAAAAVQKFERDFFARQDALARTQQAAAEQAAKKQAAEINGDVMSLPTKDVHKTLNLGGQITDPH
jgi:hypothetical protein